MAYPGHRIGPNGETYNPTLKAPKEINLEQDCMALNNAMKGAGTDEDTVIDILGHRTLKQRLAIRDHYKATFGEDLIDKLTGELTGNFEELVQMLLGDSATTKAKALYKAMAGGGTKESVIIEILCTANPSRTLESDVKEDLGGDFERLAVALLQVLTCLNRIEAYANLLKEAMNGLGTTDSTLMRIIATRCEVDLGNISQLFEAKEEQSLEQRIREETSGDYRKLLLALLGSRWQE
ncbi:Annexin [Paragonimus heterotremus]|uniref:Annexin n=1 Tax=Paragonimus heterotremus TaxID=100268 RepID=A0A8J4WL24_9TREM|nr:Annexin [Paragonimus heterotremus]